MTRERARRLLAEESKWTCGNGCNGRCPNKAKGYGRKAKKSRQHQRRLERLAGWAK